jgi:hypothetical protein
MIVAILKIVAAILEGAAIGLAIAGITFIVQRTRRWLAKKASISTEVNASPVSEEKKQR